MPNTVIILGAGASKEMGIPVGAEIKHTIADSLNFRFQNGRELVRGDLRIVQALRQYLQAKGGSIDANPYFEAAHRIRAAMPQAVSIDNFIDAHKDNKKIEICGKLAIVAAILDAERKSALFIDHTKPFPQLDYPSFEKSWFNGFFQLLTEDCRVADLEARLSSITFIAFNYDRCVEQYLHQAFQNYYGISADHAARLVQQIHIYHPYGDVGGLPWYGGAHFIEFGSQPSSQQLVALAAQIKTFTEGTDPSTSDVIAIREKLTNADRVLFLGFAFHRLNLRLLWPHERGAGSRNTLCFGTALGISGTDVGLIATELANFGGFSLASVHLQKLTCSELLREYWRSLSLR